MRLSKLLAIACFFVAAQISATVAAQIPISGYGDGIYVPYSDGTGGAYGGTGLSSFPLGFGPYQGLVEITGPVDPNDPNSAIGWKTPDGSFQVNRFWFGKLRCRAVGELRLIPIDPQRGIFTAIWTGTFTFEGGTRLFRNASGSAAVTAVNLPFNPATDPEWPFLWTWRGQLSLR